MLKMRLQQGDTIIELVLAFAIFSLCAVTTIMILNKGVALSQQSLEKSLVRQQIDSQSEIIRYIHDTQNPQWATVKAKLTTNPLPLNGPCPSVSQLGTGGLNGFYVVPEATSPGGFAVYTAINPRYSLPAAYAKIDYTAKTSEGVWVQVVRAENKSGVAGTDAYDFYIHGCWDTVGQTVPMTVGTIVRLYEK